MKFDFSLYPAFIQADTTKDPSDLGRGKWRQATLAGSVLVFAAAALIRGTAPVFANDAPPQKLTATQEHEQQFDWILHTRQTLDELKEKLNLNPGQLAAWDIWSAGVIKDGQQQLEHKGNRRDESPAEKTPVGSSTPERMTRDIERLRSETAWMQENLNQLETAQMRTSIFYGVLDTSQKITFDLFWHEMYHRVSGHELGGDLPGYRYRLPMI